MPPQVHLGDRDDEEISSSCLFGFSRLSNEQVSLSILKVLFLDQSFFFFSRPCHAAYRILVPRPGMESMPPAVEAQSLNHWPAEEVPLDQSFIKKKKKTKKKLQWINTCK